MEYIDFKDFQKIQMRVGEVVSSEKVEKAEKLLRIMVDFGELGEKQVISSIAETFTDPSVMVGKQYVFVTNLEPRVIFGLESQAMIVATEKKKGKGVEFVPAKPSKKVKPGSTFY